MTDEQKDQPTSKKPLRLWPGLVSVTLIWLVWLIVPAVVPQWAAFGMLGAVFFGLAIVVWWLFFSRAPWSERLGAILVMVAAVAATSRFVHPSISNGFMGMMLPFYAIPVLGSALVAWAVASRRLSSGRRRASMVVSILLASAGFTLIRTGGVTGEGASDLHWRWTPTPEERLLAQALDTPLDSARDTLAAPAAVTPEKPLPAPARAEPLAPTSPPAPAETPEKRVPAPAGAPLDSARGGPAARSGAPAAAKMDAAWPGFRGPARDSIIRGVRIETDWSGKPPVELWRRPIGPGWSSLAVVGDLVYTQEQRGEHEVVSSYRLTTGEPVWRHRDPVRFWESNAGAGPRATPTVSNGRVYTFGATGILNALDAGTGALVWSRNAAADTGVEIPGWGFASSPLVVNDVVIVAASGRLAAYDVTTGDSRWFGPAGGGGYSSPHLVTIDGVAQILLLRGARTTSVAPADGTLLWEHSWQPAVSIVQPALTEDGDVLITSGDAMGGLGMRRLAVAHGPGGWTVEERWTSRGLKPYFNDLVVHEGHAYGFDGSILACIDLSDGNRTWKGGRFGHGQLVLLPDQDVLLVLSEDGELALVKATPDRFTELARIPALEGKTWNHPVVAGDILLVRNGEEMAAFRLPIVGR
ncbi:MAG: PQQ-binding-like beta-propeller repeat protein [Vicinamibacterales bacterium]